MSGVDETQSSSEDDDAWAEFTEAGFRNLLQALKSNSYYFAGFTDTPEDRHVLWRHDVDLSLHRAARLAEIEAEEGTFATYFLNPRSEFYSLLEPKSLQLVRRIYDAGHEVGLHFDAAAFGSRTWTSPELDKAVRREKALIEMILERPVHCMSWHNPDLSNLLDFKDHEIGGLVNAYADVFRRDYTYASDSNGYWRFRPMAEVIAARPPKLHLLTHPDWWAPVPLPPSKRVERCIDGRAQAIRMNYGRMLREAGRRNI